MKSSLKQFIGEKEGHDDWLRPPKIDVLGKDIWQLATNARPRPANTIVI